ncbi:Flavodoxin-like fold [Flagellimonas taeanensis]|uniref:FMN dependent NADH:quinone oxidoreductase n=1 Tax=Flagellimonas taeanensis TaxID=1005926 RepID=A0A1M6X0B9_9FLAO|nr:NAD(P)H-dependent oxidoreductase [Allomuricauda taeanensis]SFB98946.1 Flavodoxin-like fold [Allomuricauda taeanensis]SHK99364.1 FMN-dependent NADH-azoreductase [Allomuricauda taeanensis]
MTQTLVLGYTPRNGSYTKILVDEFLELAKAKTKIKFLDLAKNPPDLLLTDNLNLIMEWNMGRREFTDTELSILSNHHKLIAEVLDSDNIVLAFPIYNFTMPATVKAWIDAIVVSDKTFSFSPETGFKGLCTDKKALSIVVSGFDYKSSDGIREYASSTLKQNFDFIGIASEQISAFGVDQNREQLDSILENAKHEIKRVIDSWFQF